eukprot:8461835-Karenia_brevis.AAC.1
MPTPSSSHQIQCHRTCCLEGYTENFADAQCPSILCPRSGLQVRTLCYRNRCEQNWAMVSHSVLKLSQSAWRMLRSG